MEHRPCLLRNVRCIMFGNNPCRSTGFQAVQENIQELHSASHLAMSHNQHLPPKGRTRPQSLDIGVYEHQGQREAAKQAKGRGVYQSGSGTFMFASTSMSAALDNLQFYPKVRCHLLHVLQHGQHPARAFDSNHTMSCSIANIQHQHLSPTTTCHEAHACIWHLICGSTPACSIANTQH